MSNIPYIFSKESVWSTTATAQVILHALLFIVTYRIQILQLKLIV